MMLLLTTPLLFVLFAISSNGYEYIDILKSAEEAEQHCNVYGSNLATIKTSTQLEAIQSLFPITKTRAWIGLYDDQWRDGSLCDLPYNKCVPDSFWKRNQRDGHCVSTKRYGQFTRTKCYKRLPFICNDFTISNCTRHRQPWHLLQESERDLYINGLLQLSRNGILQRFVEQHGEITANRQAHRTGSFLPWHRYFLWELESQFRLLGPQYHCFAIPYWDWTYDIQTYGFNFRDFTILNSGLGGHGDPDDRFCVKDGFFRKGEYVPFYCPDETDHDCCLQRDVCANNQTGCWMTSISEHMNIVNSWPYYGSDHNVSRWNDDGFREALEAAPHGTAHLMIGGEDGHLGHFLYSPDDPIFYLLHSFVDFNWALWQDCHDYDLIHKSLITDKVYDGELEGVPDPDLNVSWWKYYGPSDIDDTLIFTVLQKEPWAYISRNSYTNRDMHSIMDWDVTYDRGTFFEFGNVDTICSPENNNTGDNGMNTGWFPENNVRRRRQLGDEAYNENDEFLDDTFRLLKKKHDYVPMWAQMNCEYIHMDNLCVKPKYFDDCSDIKGYLGAFMDIDATLNELIEKVADYPCMVAIREKLYEWAKQSGTLWKLCRGDYDVFCDKTSIHDDTDPIMVVIENNDCVTCNCNASSKSADNMRTLDRMEISKSGLIYNVNGGMHHNNSNLLKLVLFLYLFISFII